MPIFALANAGVTLLQNRNLGEMLMRPTTMGVWLLSCWEARWDNTFLLGCLPIEVSSTA